MSQGLEAANAIRRYPMLRKIQEAHDKEVENLLADARELALIVGCLEPAENGAPVCDPPCIACRYSYAQ